MRLRWVIVWARLDPVAGREQAGLRPVLVVSNEAFNQTSGLVTVVPLTSSRRPARSWEALLPSHSTGLPHDSLALPQQIRTISKERIQRAAGQLRDADLRSLVAERVRLHLELDHVELE